MVLSTHREAQGGYVMSLWDPEFFPEVEALDKSSCPRDRYFPQLRTKEVADVRGLHAPSSWLMENWKVLGYYQVTHDVKVFSALLMPWGCYQGFHSSSKERITCQVWPWRPVGPNEAIIVN